MASTIPDVYGVDVRGLDFAAAVAPVFASRADMVVAYSHRLPFKRARVESFELVDKAIALCREKTDSVIPPDLFTTPPELAQLRPYLAAFVLGSTLSRCLLQSSVEGVDWDEKITSIGLAEILHSTDCKEPDKEGDGDSQPQEASDQTARLLLLRELSCLVSKAQFAFTAPLLKCCHNPQCSFEGLRTPGVHDLLACPLFLQSALALFRLADSAPKWEEGTEAGSWVACVWDLQLTGMQVVRLLCSWSSAVQHHLCKRSFFMKTLRAACEKGPMSVPVSPLSLFPREAQSLFLSVLREQPPLAARWRLGERLAEKMGGGSVEMAAALVRGALAEVCWLPAPPTELLLNLAEKLRDLASVFRQNIGRLGKSSDSSSQKGTKVITEATLVALASEKRGDREGAGEVGLSLMCKRLLQVLFACKVQKDMGSEDSLSEGCWLHIAPPASMMVVGFYQCLGMVLMNRACLDDLAATPAKIDQMIAKLRLLSDASIHEMEEIEAGHSEQKGPPCEEHPTCKVFIELLKNVKNAAKRARETHQQQQKQQQSQSRRRGRERRGRKGNSGGGHQAPQHHPPFSLLEADVATIHSMVRQRLTEADISHFAKPDKPSGRTEPEDRSPLSEANGVPCEPQGEKGTPLPAASASSDSKAQEATEGDQWRDLRPPPCSECLRFVGTHPTSDSEDEAPPQGRDVPSVEGESPNDSVGRKMTRQGKGKAGKGGDGKNRCGGCGFAYFCDSQCLRSAWKGGHKSRCRLMSLHKREDGRGCPFASFDETAAECAHAFPGWTPGGSLQCALGELARLLVISEPAVQRVFDQEDEGRGGGTQKSTDSSSAPPSDLSWDYTSLADFIDLL